MGSRGTRRLFPAASAWVIPKSWACGTMLLDDMSFSAARLSMRALILASAWATRRSLARARYRCFPDQRHSGGNYSKLGKLTTFNDIEYGSMLGDTARLDAYQRDIGSTVAGQRVLEIGPGPMAVLAKMCLDGGATEVVAIEGNATAARQAKAELGRNPSYASRWSVIRGLSSEVSPADVPGGPDFDVLVLELYNYIAAREQVVETVSDLRQRGFTFRSVISRGYETWVAPARTPPRSPRNLGRLVRGQRPWPTLPRRPVAAFVKGDMNDLSTLRLSRPQLWQQGGFENNVIATTVPDMTFPLEHPESYAGLLFHNRFLFHGDVLDTSAVPTHWGMYFVPLALPADLMAQQDAVTLHTECPDPGRPSIFTLTMRAADQVSAPAVFGRPAR